MLEGPVPGPGMQPPVVSAHDCSLFFYSFKQSRAAVRLKQDMKKVVVRPPGPSRRVFGVPLKDLHREGSVINGVPAVVWSVVEYLRREGLTQEGLFRINGNVKVVEQLRGKYENGEQVTLPEDGDVHSAASLLKLFLREMPDGVISAALLPRFLQVYQESGSDPQRESGLKALIKELPDTHYSLLKYLCHFLMQVVQHHAVNKMNVHNLATVFGPSCFHVSPGFEGLRQQEICNKIVAKLLEDYTEFFECEPTEKDALHDDVTRIITVKEYSSEKPFVPPRLIEIQVASLSPKEKETLADVPVRQGSNPEIIVPCISPRKKLNKVHSEKQETAVPEPKQSLGVPQSSFLVTNRTVSPESDLVDHLGTSSSDSFHRYVSR